MQLIGISLVDEIVRYLNNAIFIATRRTCFTLPRQNGGIGMNMLR